jgi:hypothetical protein
MLSPARNTWMTLPAVLGAAASLLITGTAVAAAAPARNSGPPPRYTVRQVLSGTRLRHSFGPASTTHRRSAVLTAPDDITALGGDLFTAFQNGVGPQGQAAPDGNRDSTIVEFAPDGRPVRQWDIRGKCDGVTAELADHRLIATVNEDAHSSIYTITPGAPSGDQVQHYSYNVPLPSKGGTDAISVSRGLVLISASAPGTTGAAAPQASYPAVYRVTFRRATHVASVHALFSDEAGATVANLGTAGRTVPLALTDPDSNAIVPLSAPRFARDFMLTSQGDKEQVYVQRAGTHRQRLLVLRLSQSVDDTAWATARFGRLYATDADSDTVDLVTGQFPRGAVFVAVTPCGANGAPATCPAPPMFPANYLGVLNPWTGQIARVTLSGPTLHPQGMAFVRVR